MYPARYQLPELTAHVVATLERRREGYAEWNPEAEQKLTAEAKTALAEAGRQFAEVADDKPYWEQLERTILTAALPRYFALAKAELAAEKNKYGVWRGGDLVSRAVYAAAGLLGSALVLRTALPDVLEVLPLAFLVFGPLVPDVQVWLARRRYSKRLQALVDDMREEAAARAQYRPLTEAVPAPVDEQAAGDAKTHKPKDKESSNA